ncbi:MAG: DUF6495 family protein [Cytophagaceae bacterium]|jgi:hypothetical protein|nr:DUF6495 family protein [Cytophagaceae bacterium]
MTLYRRLTLDELQHLEQEFIHFLIVQGIDATDWVKMKEERMAEADQLIDIFSDIVLESSLKKISFLEIRTPKYIHTYQCLSNTLVLIALEADPSSEIDFTLVDPLQEHSSKNRSALSVFTSTRPYSVSKEYDVFKLTEMGCLISDGLLFKQLSLLL